jgi:hypothetical protein
VPQIDAETGHVVGNGLPVRGQDSSERTAKVCRKSWSRMPAVPVGPRYPSCRANLTNTTWARTLCGARPGW